MSDDKLLDDINRATRAAQIVDGDLFKEAAAAIERDLIIAWKLTSQTDIVARERLWQGVLMVGKMEEFFRSAIDNGKLAQNRLNELTREKPKWEAVR